MDSQLREALARAAAPVVVGVEERARVLDAVAGDHRRRRTLLAVGGAVAAVVVTAVGVGLLSGGGDDRADVSDHDRRTPTGGWEAVAESPLSARDRAVAAWTGEEVIVVGGTTAIPCPGLSECPAPPPSSELADGAAYDPASDTWRAIAPAPIAFAGGLALRVGDQVLVVSDRQTLTYVPATNTWDQLADLPARTFITGLVATDEGAVGYSYDQHPRSATASDWELDFTTGKWTPLPQDPFRESYDRSIAWYDGRLWLLSMDVAHHFDAVEGAPSRIAVLDGSTWTVVDDETPDLTYQQRLVELDDRLVVAMSGYDVHYIN